MFAEPSTVVPADSYWRGTRRVQGAARVARTDPPNGWLALILCLLLSIGFSAYLHYCLNDVRRADADPPSGQVPPAIEDSMPPATGRAARTGARAAAVPGFIAAGAPRGAA